MKLCPLCQALLPEDFPDGPCRRCSRLASAPLIAPVPQGDPLPLGAPQKLGGVGPKLRRILCAVVIVTVGLALWVFCFGGQGNSISGMAMVHVKRVQESHVIIPEMACLMGEGSERIPGFIRPGPTLPSGAKELHVRMKKPTQEMHITRLHYAVEDSVPRYLNESPVAVGFTEEGTKGLRLEDPRYHNVRAPASELQERIRKLDLWVPPTDGIFCGTLLSNEPTTPGLITLLPTIPLPDGVYCLHTDGFQEGLDLPEITAQFTIGGLSEFRFAGATAGLECGKMMLSLAMINEGMGEFNEHQLAVMLQKDGLEDEDDSRITRWMEASPIVPAGGSNVFTKAFNVKDLAPGNYHFSGYVAAVGTYDANDHSGAFTSNSFSIPANAIKPR